MSRLKSSGCGPGTASARAGPAEEKSTPTASTSQYKGVGVGRLVQRMTGSILARGSGRRNLLLVLNRRFFGPLISARERRPGVERGGLAAMHPGGVDQIPHDRPFDAEAFSGP